MADCMASEPQSICSWSQLEQELSVQMDGSFDYETFKKCKLFSDYPQSTRNYSVLVGILPYDALYRCFHNLHDQINITCEAIIVDRLCGEAGEHMAWSLAENRAWG
jgi:hypothetical protein